MPKIDKKLSGKPEKVKIKKKKEKPARKSALIKPRSVRSKENTLSYYNCILEQVSNNVGVKITKMCNWCRSNKGKVAAAKQIDKRELVDKVAKGYLEFGKGLGHLLHADIVGCSCKK